MDVGPISPEQDGHSVTSAGGWCAPSEALYDLMRVPPLMPGQMLTPAPPPTLWERLRALPERLRAARHAAREAFREPDGYWEVD